MKWAVTLLLSISILSGCGTSSGTGTLHNEVSSDQTQGEVLASVPGQDASDPIEIDDYLEITISPEIQSGWKVVIDTEAAKAVTTYLADKSRTYVFITPPDDQKDTKYRNSPYRENYTDGTYPGLYVSMSVSNGGVKLTKNLIIALLGAQDGALTVQERTPKAQALVSALRCVSWDTYHIDHQYNNGVTQNIYNEMLQMLCKNSTPRTLFTVTSP